MQNARPHQRLYAWQIAMTLVKEVYQETQLFPMQERYGLTAQARRAAVSVPSNIAEGAARTGSREFARFLSHSRGSLAELETHLLIAVELGYMSSSSTVFERIERVSQLLTGLLRSVRPGVPS